MTKHKFSFTWPSLRRSAALRVQQKPVDDRQARFDAEVQKGLDDVAAGRVKDADEVFDRLDAKYQAMAKRRR
jgi:antitoxin ParD1/3/4